MWEEPREEGICADWHGCEGWRIAAYSSYREQGAEGEKKGERKRKKILRVRQTVRQADMESAYLRRERKLPKRKDQALNERELKIRHILKKQAHLEKRKKVNITSSKPTVL